MKKENFGRISAVIEPPALLNMQITSFEEFLQSDVPPEKRKPHGLQGAFKDVFPKESALRDHLAANLHLIGDGLSLIDKEFPLSSEHGADGAIDILAADALGHFVIIEVKRSNATARADIHVMNSSRF